MNRWIISCVILLPAIFLPVAPGLAETVISGVPGYSWHHGSGPTAMGMVLAYWSGHGFPGLMPGDGATQTHAVDQIIASEGTLAVPLHFEDYCIPIDTGEAAPLPDKSEDPAGDEHLSNCIADFMRTSFSRRGNIYGWSRIMDIGAAWEKIVDQQSNHQNRGLFSVVLADDAAAWNTVKVEIDANYPMIFHVDTDGDDLADHFVTVVGYREGAMNEYGCLDTWDPVTEIRWCEFKAMSQGTFWGVHQICTLNIWEMPDITLQLDDGSAEANLGYTTPQAKAKQFLWMNQFTPDPGDFPMEILGIDVMFGRTGIMPGDVVQIVVYEDIDGGEPDNAFFVASRLVETAYTNGLAWSGYEVLPPIRLDGPGDVLVGVVNRHVNSGVSDPTFPAMIDIDRSHLRSWIGVWEDDPPDPPVFPATEAWGRVDMFGFEGSFMIRVHARKPLQTGVEITMPSTYFTPGDLCNCVAGVTNITGGTLTGYPLFVVLDVFGSYYFAPGFTDFDYYTEDFPFQYHNVIVLPDFTWPDAGGPVHGIRWYGALTDPTMTSLYGDMGTFEFGWGD